MSQYQFRGWKPTGVDPDEAGQELSRIYQERGRLTPADVVEEASHEGSPLHRAFDWQDDSAARKWREHQARHLIRAVVVVEGDRKPQPLFIHVRQEHQQGYHQASVVARSPDLYDAAMSELLGKLAVARRAVSELEDAAGQDREKAGRAKRVDRKLAEAEVEATA